MKLLKRSHNIEHIHLMVILFLFLIFYMRAEAAPTLAQSYLGLHLNQFMVQELEQETAADAQNYFIKGRWLSRPSFFESEDPFHFKGDIQGRYSSQKGELLNFFSVHELSYSHSIESQNFSWVLGRSKQNWSAIDDEWMLGAWQPILKVEPLHPETQGLTGFFLNWQTNLNSKINFKSQFFATPLFLPDQGPDVETREGRFLGGHPWMPLPPQQITVLDVPTPIYYDWQSPTISEIIFRQGYGAKMQIESEDANSMYSLQGSYANLPSHQMVLAFRGKLKSMHGQEKMLLELRPFVERQRLMALDFHLQMQNFSLNLAALNIEPEKTFNVGEGGWSYPTYQSSQLWSPTLTWSQKRWSGAVSYLKRQGGNAVGVGPQGEFTTQVFPAKYNFTELLKFRGQWLTLKKAKQVWTQQWQWTRELKEQSDIVTFESRYETSKNWSFYGGFDLVASDNKNPSLTDRAENYLNNDQVYTGVDYVF